jgi:hypothetical protein
VTVYLYGLLLDRNAHLGPAHVTGVGSTVLRVVVCDPGGLGALVSTLERAPQRASLEDIKAHDHALQSVVAHGSTTAAVRFGQTFASDAELRRHVSEHGSRLARVLEQYDGCVEMRLLLAELPPPDSEASKADPIDAIGMGPGRAYLESLKQGRTRLSGISLKEALGPTVLAEHVEELAPAPGVVFSHLIKRPDEPAYREAVAAFPALADFRIVGPLALYSFAEPA